VKLLNILGLIIFSVGALSLVSFGLYEFFKDSTVPIVVKWGIVSIILGVIVILISLARERLKEKDL